MLSLCSLLLIATGTTQLTWGPEIARTQLLPPHIYLLIFLVALPGQFLFGVASMTLAAVATTYTFGLVSFAITGTYYFFEPSIPIAVFLSMHLLFTDPSTSPRTELGRLMFGVLYGLSVVVVYALLVWAGAPPFYDKLLAVPVLNLTIQANRSDRAIESAEGTRPSSAGAPSIATMAVRRLYRRMGRCLHDHTAHDREPRGFGAGGHADVRGTDRGGNNLGLVVMQSGRSADAVSSFARAVELQPDYAEAHYNLAQAYNGVGRSPAAVGEFREALRVRPDWPTALGALAWTESTNGDAGVYDPADAVRLATRAAELSQRKDAPILDALAAAYAAAGRFSEATKIAEEAQRAPMCPRRIWPRTSGRGSRGTELASLLSRFAASLENSSSESHAVVRYL